MDKHRKEQRLWTQEIKTPGPAPAYMLVILSKSSTSALQEVHLKALTYRDQTKKLMRFTAEPPEKQKRGGNLPEAFPASGMALALGKQN